MKTDETDMPSCEKICNRQRTYPRAHPMTILALLFIVMLILLMPMLEGLPSSLQKYVGQTITVTGTVAESRDGNGYLWLKLDKSGEIVYASLPRDWNKPDAAPVWYPAGTRLAVSGIVEEPQGQRNPGGFNERQWLLSKQARMKLLAKEMDAVQVSEQPKGIWKLSYNVQCSIKQMARQYLSEEQQGLALALLLGEKQQLNQEFYRLTQRMGIAHVFAVSGLHVGFVGGVLLWFFKRIGWERNWFSFLCMAMGLGFYCIVTGLQPSAIRAAVMLLLAALALRLLRPPAAVDFLSLAAILLLLDNPFLLYTAGFQLSFGVTLALLLFVRPIQRHLHVISSTKLRDALAVALAACLGSLPLTAWHFYMLSLLSPLYNLLLVPLASVLVPALLLAFLLTALLPVGGEFFFFPIKLLLNLMQYSTTVLADLFGIGHWYVGRPGWPAVICYGLFLFCLWRWLASDYREQKNRLARNSSFIVLLLVVALSVPSVPHHDELLYLDAGQGSSAILRTEQGEVVIFDGGVQQRELASCLAWYGINEVKAIVLSHGDTDHTGGLAQVMENIPVQYLCMEKSQTERAEVQPLLAQAEACGVDVKLVSGSARLNLQYGEIRLETFSDGGAGSNSRELTAVACINDTIIAFPGDLEIRGVEAFVQKQEHLDIWTVPHHGSRYSASEGLYQQLKQKGVKLAVISAGKDNSYGHPHSEVVNLLQTQQIPVYRTDLEGFMKIPLN